MGKREGCAVDASSVVGEVSGLVTISVVTGSLVASMAVRNGAVIVTTVGVSVGVVLPIMMVVSTVVG